ncbi:LamG domain-containing protein [Candidatus Poribacteria bacterium]|nr:LamG domain-containing protein [Candidatus Poribacteria bacterium]
MKLKKQTIRKHVGHIIGLCILMFSVSILTQLVNAEDLVLHLSFDELNGKTSKDISEFRNDVTFTGSPKLVEGKFGKAIDFDGKTHGEVLDHSSLDIVDGVTIELWAKLRPGSPIHTGLEKGPAWGPGLYTLAPLYNGGSLLQFFDLPDNCDDENIGGNILDGEWHFMAGTWDGKTIKLYIDGVLDKELACKGELVPNNGALYIGARGGSDRFLTGALDEIKMYNYALSEDELLTDMDNPLLLNVEPQGKLTTTWARLKGE